MERTWEGTGLEVLNAKDFDADRLRRTGRYVVVFGATWCPPTRKFVPRFKSWSMTVDARAAVADITDLESPLWDVFSIKITPSVLCFQDGATVHREDGHRIVGVRDRQLEAVAEFLRTGPAPHRNR